MATYNVTRAKHATLTAATVDTVNVTALAPALEHPTSKVAIINRGTDPISYRYGRADVADPTVLGDDTLLLPASAAAVHDWDSRVPLIVKLISTGTPAYTVQEV